MSTRHQGQAEAEAAVSEFDEERLDDDLEVEVLEAPSLLPDVEPSDDVEPFDDVEFSEDLPSDEPSDAEEPPEPLAARLLAEA
jgi:hypothetical protein